MSSEPRTTILPLAASPTDHTKLAVTEDAEPPSHVDVQPKQAAPGHILVVDDDPDTCELLRASLHNHGHDAITRTDALSALTAIETEFVTAVVTGVYMCGMSGLELCMRVRESHPDIPIIVTSGHAGMAIAALRAGAHDFVPKPVDVQQLLSRLEKALRHFELETEIRRLERALSDAEPTTMIGESPSVKRVRSMIKRVADSDAPVLITGECGVGKELVARELHRRSKYANGPFVAVDCAAVSAQLLESELFLQANGGTLFLDQIGALPLEMQPKLLCALQERKIWPVARNTSASFDARIIAADHRDLETEVEERRFYKALFYRINVVDIQVPPLRARGTDILLLAQHFLDRFNAGSGRQLEGLSTDVAEMLLRYDWPGNVRELEHCIERAAASARYNEITAADLPNEIRKPVVEADDPPKLPTLAELQRRHVRRVLRAVEGNEAQAMQVLGIDRRSLNRHIQGLGDDSADTDPAAESP